MFACSRTRMCACLLPASICKYVCVCIYISVVLKITIHKIASFTRADCVCRINMRVRCLQFFGHTLALPPSPSPQRLPLLKTQNKTKIVCKQELASTLKTHCVRFICYCVVLLLLMIISLLMMVMGNDDDDVFKNRKNHGENERMRRESELFWILFFRNLFSILFSTLSDRILVFIWFFFFLFVRILCVWMYVRRFVCCCMRRLMSEAKALFSPLLDTFQMCSESKVTIHVASHVPLHWTIIICRTQCVYECACF